MSLSNPTLTNPAQHFFEWKGAAGKLQWYDKENKKNVDVKLPFTFIVLDQLNTIAGYNKQMESGFWSNEVRNVSKDELYVRTAKGPFEAGIYANLTQTRSKGGKYAKSIYIAHKIGNDWVLGNIQATGSCLSAWIEFTKAHAVDSGKVIMKQGAKQTAPTGEYYPPEFTWEKWEPEEYDAAIVLDKELQIYLTQYLATQRDEDGREVTDDTLATPEQVADFEKRKASAQKPVSADIPDQVFDPTDDPIDLNEIPF
jgi:hypothetical protein